MHYDTILMTRDESLATVRLNRPDKRNALNATMRAELIDALDRLAEDDHIKVVILTGSGERAFVAGADVAEFADRSVDQQREHTYGRRVYEVVSDFPKPTIAAIHGYCLGGGSELALACDLRVASRSARFAQAEICVGLIPGAGGTQRITRFAGYGQALRIALSGEMIDGAEAYRIGLVEFLVEDGEHLKAARDLAARIARWSPSSLRLVKRAIRAAMEAPVSEGLTMERELFLAAFGSDDGREGVRAFLESRQAVFHGR